MNTFERAYWLPVIFGALSTPMRLLSLLPLFAVPVVASSQMLKSKDFDFELGKPYTVIDAPSKNYFAVPDGLVAVKVDGNKYFLQKMSGETLSQVCMKEVRDLPKGHALETFVEMEGRIFLFYSMWDKPAQTEELWYREVDTKNCGFVGESTNVLKVKGKITGYLSRRSMFSYSTEGKWTFIPSLDGQRLLVKYRKKPEERDDSKNKDVIGMVVFDKTMKEEWRSELTMPYTEEMMDNLDEAVDGEGNGYLLALVREKTKKEVKRGEEIPSHLEVLRFGAGATDFDAMPVDLPDMFLNGLRLFEGANGTMLCSGFYTKGRKAMGAEGVFTFAIGRTGAVQHVDTIDIPMDVINQNLSERAQRKNEEREQDDKSVGIPNLRMERVLVKDNGGMVLIGEQFYMQQHTSRMGNSTYTYYTYHYENLLVTSISPSGQLEWMKKFPKRQVTKNASGGGCGISTFETADNLYILYMDNVKNMNLADNKMAETHSDGQGGFLTAYKVDWATGEPMKTSILDTRDAKGTELFQIGIDRIVPINDTEFFMEAYKKGKEDVLVRVFMVGAGK